MCKACPQFEMLSAGTSWGVLLGWCVRRAGTHLPSALKRATPSRHNVTAISNKQHHVVRTRGQETDRGAMFHHRTAFSSAPAPAGEYSPAALVHVRGGTSLEAPLSSVACRGGACKKVARGERVSSSIACTQFFVSCCNLLLVILLCGVFSSLARVLHIAC